MSGAPIEYVFSHFLKLVMLVLLVAFAAAARADDWQTCNDESGDVAIAVCSRAIESGKFKGAKLATLYQSRGHEYFKKVYTALDKLDEVNLNRALADFDESIKIAPDASCLTCRCSARTFAAQFQGALTDCNEALRRDPKETTALMNRGFVKYRLGQLEPAIRDFSESLRLQKSKAAGNFYGRGLAKQKSGDKTGGDTDIAEALKIDPGIAKSWIAYAAGLK
jgi:tetratricopeptide (TPR) repeat protein